MYHSCQSGSVLVSTGAIVLEEREGWLSARSFLRIPGKEKESKASLAKKEQGWLRADGFKTLRKDRAGWIGADELDIRKRKVAFASQSLQQRTLGCRILRNAREQEWPGAGYERP